MKNSTSSLCFLSAMELLRLLKNKEISAVELMQAHLDQIKKINPIVNAIVILLDEERLLEQARAADILFSKNAINGLLQGIPLTHKDMAPTKNIRTTFGSPIFANNIPDFDELIVERTAKAGAILIGKTNTPEFAAGSHTYNKVFGATANPWDITKSAGGSSGGAAVSLACGMNPLSCGADMGGSLRNPAAWNNIIGLRPSPGRVPTAPSKLPWLTLAVEGPMARTVADIALLMSVIAGPTNGTACAIEEPNTIFTQSLHRNFKGVKIAMFQNVCGDLQDPEIKKIVRAQTQVFEELGCVVEQRDPDFLDDTDDVFRCERAMIYGASYYELMTDEQKLSQIKPEVVEEFNLMKSFNSSYIAQMQRKKGEIFAKMRAFMNNYEFYILPTTSIHPFNIELPWPNEINGHKLDSYLDWMKICWCITATEHPSLAMPCGFGANGMPVGLQIVGRWHDDFGVLQLGHAYEALTGYAKQRPPLVDS
ncbi:Glutamyl-tRNA(Gln) amidotransferase subunit A [Legionella massiliensis]|uniref:Glutamyl-tRNA(Gln) amidotransferase subunit A n=1 Tax=Legionella massiliensis TaxID=1034943 RepID=A0A078KTS7_9GAMM|nr:amidase [Legionella massiliensis]CDZ76431.1 Glutamyl-tRNA(Gln) amidotransferase subunit A [Legionella massiliensis]CEE12169.1 Acylamidase [Legionella massiliensis]